tara:strand:- start:909 stop:1073 length:165 start_codon:yes stop_codon:yes gene_type:complete
LCGFKSIKRYYYIFARGEEVGETTKKQKNTDENRIGEIEKERRMIGSIRFFFIF